MIKEKLKQHKSFIITIITIFLLFAVPLPFYIEKEGGVIATKNRIDIENAYKADGEFYMTYVSEIKVNIPLYIISFFNKNWDLIKKEEVILNNETEEDVYFRSKLLLDESIQNAIIAAYNLANKTVNITKEDCYVTYIDSLANTDLQIKDKIIKINNIKVTNRNHIHEIINNYKVGDILNFEVERNNNILKCTAKLIEIEGNAFIGVMISTKKEIVTKPNIDIKFEKGESGSSGGLMMALEIYNSLTEEDITKGRKIAGTGTIDENGNVGKISGIKYKIKGASKDADIFLAPSGENYLEAIQTVKDYNLDIKVIEVSTLKEAITKLKEG